MYTSGREVKSYKEKKYLNCEISIITDTGDNQESKTLALSLIKRFEKLSNLSKKDLGEFTKNLKSLNSTSEIADNISSNLNIQIFENLGTRTKKMN